MKKQQTIKKTAEHRLRKTWIVLSSKLQWVKEIKQVKRRKNAADFCNFLVSLSQAELIKV